MCPKCRYLLINSDPVLLPERQWGNLHRGRYFQVGSPKLKCHLVWQIVSFPLKYPLGVLFYRGDQCRFTNTFAQPADTNLKNEWVLARRMSNRNALVAPVAKRERSCLCLLPVLLQQTALLPPVVAAGMAGSREAVEESCVTGISWWAIHIERSKIASTGLKVSCVELIKWSKKGGIAGRWCNSSLQPALPSSPPWKSIWRKWCQTIWWMTTWNLRHGENLLMIYWQ